MAVSALAVPASEGINARAAQSVSCSSSHPVAPADCRNLINTYISDQTQVVGDTNRRAVLTLGNCAAVLKSGGNEVELTTKANLAARASLIDQVCDTGSGFSGILSGDAVGAD